MHESSGMDWAERHGRLRALRDELVRLERAQQVLGCRSSRHTQLLSGEGLGVGQAEAARWAAVYRDLIRFNEGLITDMRRKARGREPGLAAELLKHARSLQPELERLRVHQWFWDAEARRNQKK